MSSKLAAFDHPILDLLAQRWSPRAFSSRPVSPEILDSLFEAARWTQSSSNEQPWNFLVTHISDTAAREKMTSALASGNSWARKAGVLGVAIAKQNFARNGKPNRVAIYDLGAAMMALTIQATSMGLYVHQMGGFDIEIARQAGEVPSGYDPVTMFALGYLGDPDSLNPEQRAKELAARTRKPVHEFVFQGTWGRTAIRQPVP